MSFKIGFLCGLGFIRQNRVINPALLVFLEFSLIYIK
jgi:hypothetical protein